MIHHVELVNHCVVVLAGHWIYWIIFVVIVNGNLQKTLMVEPTVPTISAQIWRSMIVKLPSYLQPNLTNLLAASLSIAMKHGVMMVMCMMCLNILLLKGSKKYISLMKSLSGNVRAKLQYAFVLEVRLL